ncbi:MAG: amidase [Gammaproteobacteria bacterium]
MKSTAPNTAPGGWKAPFDPLGAFCRDNPAALKGSGRDPLAGLTFAVKDVFHIKDAVTGFGQPDWLKTHGPAMQTAVAVQRLLDAGADMLGKTHTDELAYSLTGENVHYGTPVNPCDPDRIPGGSSNGSVSAVAGGLVDFAIGTDCGGSVRLPASYCGVFGIRPTHGRVSLEGVIPFGPSFDVAGWFARDPDILERVGGVLLGADEHTHAPPRRLLCVADAFDMVDQRVSDALIFGVETIADAVGAREELTLSAHGLRTWFETFRVIQAWEVSANHGAWVASVGPDLGPGIRERFEWAATVTIDQVTAHRKKREAIQERLNEVMGPGDILCLPTSPRIAPLKNTPTDQIEVEYRNQAMCLLCVAGLGGLPQISMPMAELDGMPLGLSIIGPRGHDSALLELARRICPA